MLRRFRVPISGNWDVPYNQGLLLDLPFRRRNQFTRIFDGKDQQQLAEIRASVSADISGRHRKFSKTVGLWRGIKVKSS